MREIKYRAFIKDIGVMCPVGALYFGRNYDLEGVSCHIPNGYVSTKNVADVYLMQYTGLKDKNGVDIYEGDVLFHPLQGRRKVFYPYSETVASYGLRNIDNGFGSTLQDSHAVWEVIGNIYEHKHLLE